MSLFDAFLGRSQEKTITDASATARREIGEGLDNYVRTTKQYLERALPEYDRFAPTFEQGQGALGLLSNALGINGPAAQSSFFSGFQTDPGYQAGLDAGIQALDRSAAARGLLRSGGQQRDLFGFGQRYLSEAFNNRLNSLFGLGQYGTNLGFNTATNRANLLTGAGQGIANAQFGTGQLMANNFINQGNAQAAAQSAGINNLLGLGRIIGGVAMAPFTGGTSLFART